MDNLIGKTILISGMTLKVISDNDDKWECRNITTKEPVSFKKSVLENAIKLAKAEIISDQDS